MKKRKISQPIWCQNCQDYTVQKSIDKYILGKYQCIQCGRIEDYITITIQDPKRVKFSQEIMRINAEAWYRDKDKPFTL